MQLEDRPAATRSPSDRRVARQHRVQALSAAVCLAFCGRRRASVSQAGYQASLSWCLVVDLPLIATRKGCDAWRASANKTAARVRVRDSRTRLLVRWVWAEPTLRLNYADADGNRSREPGCLRIAPKLFRDRSASQPFGIGEIGSRRTCSLVLGDNARCRISLWSTSGAKRCSSQRRRLMALRMVPRAVVPWPEPIRIAAGRLLESNQALFEIDVAGDAGQAV